MRARRGYFYLVAVILLIIGTLIAMYSGVGTAYAATTRYSGVMDDLKRDSTFNIADYPTVDDDYSLSVIQIAESTNNELFLYVYQPSAKAKFLKATQVNMSLSETADGTQLYSLTYLNGAGVIQKYRVNGVTVRANKAFRYYNITSIYREYDSAIDDYADNLDDENITDSKAYRVGKVFTATTKDGEILYNQEPTYAIEIIDPFVDSLPCSPSHYSGGLWWWQSVGWNLFDSHFIAFSTDWDIDRLVSADISYVYGQGTAYYDSLFGAELNADISYGDFYREEITVPADEKFTHEDKIHGFTYNTYSWKKLNSAADFISQVSSSKAYSSQIINNLKNNLSNSEWVISFLETERTQKDNNILGVYKKFESSFTKVSKVTILRLEFETNGKAYNLGAVSNIVSSTNYPEEVNRHWYDGIINFFNRIKDFFTNLTRYHWLLIIIAVVVAIVLIIGIIKYGIGAVINLIGLLLKKIAQAVWWLISRPFVGIAALNKKRKEAAPAKATPAKTGKRKTPKRKSSTSRSSSTRKTRTGSKTK